MDTFDKKQMSERDICTKFITPAIEEAKSIGQSPLATGRRVYKARLDPPAGPPADAEGNFLPLPQWLPGRPRPANWPLHIHGPKECYDWAKENGIDWRTLLEETPTTCGEITK